MVSWKYSHKSAHWYLRYPVLTLSKLSFQNKTCRVRTKKLKPPLLSPVDHAPINPYEFCRFGGSRYLYYPSFYFVYCFSSKHKTFSIWNLPFFTVKLLIPKIPNVFPGLLIHPSLTSRAFAGATASAPSARHVLVGARVAIHKSKLFWCLRMGKIEWLSNYPTPIFMVNIP